MNECECDPAKFKKYILESPRLGRFFSQDFITHDWLMAGLGENEIYCIFSISMQLHSQICSLNESQSKNLPESPMTEALVLHIIFYWTQWCRVRLPREFLIYCTFKLNFTTTKIYSFKSNVNIYNAKDTRKFQTIFDLFVVTVLTIQPKWPTIKDEIWCSLSN